jgi:hypothetical protein
MWRYRWYRWNNGESDIAWGYRGNSEAVAETIVDNCEKHCVGRARYKSPKFKCPGLDADGHGGTVENFGAGNAYLVDRASGKSWIQIIFPPTDGQRTGAVDRKCDGIIDGLCCRRSIHIQKQLAD